MSHKLDNPQGEQTEKADTKVSKGTNPYRKKSLSLSWPGLPNLERRKGEKGGGERSLEKKQRGRISSSPPCQFGGKGMEEEFWTDLGEKTLLIEQVAKIRPDG